MPEDLSMHLEEEELSGSQLTERFARLWPKQEAEVLRLAEDASSTDLAEAISSLAPEICAEIMQKLPFDQAAAAFDEHEFHAREKVVEFLNLDFATALCEAMSPDERADLFSLLSSAQAEVLRPRLSREVAQNLSALLRYKPETAGGIMTTEFVALRPKLTVGEAISQIRTVAKDMETIYYTYLVDAATGVLVGVVSLRDILLSEPDAVLESIMFTDPKTVHVDTDQEDVSKLLARYDLLAVPVLNHKYQLVGIVTVDDVLDVLVEEQGEDMHKLGAVEPPDTSYLLTGFWEMIRKRASWLVMLFLGGLFTTYALEHYQGTLKQFAFLVSFLPLVISSGGNSGSQSATLVVRAMAMNEVELNGWWKVLRREIAQGFVLGLILGFIGFGRAYSCNIQILGCLTIAFTLICVVTAGTVLGAMLPMFFRSLGFDPAVSSTPFIASLVDIAGILVYLSIAMLLLH